MSPIIHAKHGGFSFKDMAINGGIAPESYPPQELTTSEQIRRVEAAQDGLDKHSSLMLVDHSPSKGVTCDYDSPTKT